MVTIKNCKEGFLYRDTSMNSSCLIDRAGLKSLANGEIDELVIDDRGGKRVYKIDDTLKGVDKPVEKNEDAEGC